MTRAILSSFLLTSLLLMVSWLPAEASVITQGYFPNQQAVERLTSKPIVVADLANQLGTPNFTRSDEQNNELNLYYLHQVQKQGVMKSTVTLARSYVVLVFAADTKLFKYARYYYLSGADRQDYTPLELTTSYPELEKGNSRVNWALLEKLSGLEVKKYATITREELKKL